MIDEKKSPLSESSTPQWLSLKRTRYYQEHAGISCIFSHVYISVGITYFSQSKKPNDAKHKDIFPVAMTHS